MILCYYDSRIKKHSFSSIKNDRVIFDFTPHHDMIWYYIIWYDMIWYDMIWYDDIVYQIILYYIIVYHIILYYIKFYDVI